MFSPEQLKKASELAEELEKSPWHVGISRDKRKAQILDPEGQSVFGGSWVLSPNEAEKVVAVRELFPEVLKTLLAQEKQLDEIFDLLSNLKNVFSELQNYDELQTWAEKGLDLLNAIEKARHE